jgi:concanavalin A-like lectin/glucanase superfamily protein
VAASPFSQGTSARVTSPIEVMRRLPSAGRPAVRPLRLGRFLLRRSVALAVALVGLGAVMHFLPGRPVLTVDGFFHLTNTLNCGQDTRSWTFLTSTGQPNSNLGLLPADCSIALLQSTRMPLWTAEALFEALLAMAAAAGMYMAAGRVGRLLAIRSRIAEIVAALFWVANPFALSYIWYHVLYVQVLWAALPWLCLFILAAEGDRRIWKICLGAFAVGVAASPGLTEAELPQTFLVLAFLCLFVGVTGGRKAIIRSLAVLGSCGSALLWWLVPSLSDLGNLYSQAATGQNTAAVLDFASHYSTVWHLLTLTAVPQLYQSVNGVPYIAWSSLVTSGPGQLVLACIPLLGAIGIVRSSLRPSGWKQISPLVAMLALGVMICKGVTQPLPGMGELLTRLPLGAIFRQPLNNFGLLIVLPLTLFVGFGVATVLRMPAAFGASAYKRVVVIAASAGSVGALAVIVAPWWSSHVFPAGGGVFNSATYVLPSEYLQVGAMLGRSPAGGKTLELPFSSDGESAFVWPAGVQPNSDPLFEVWQPHRSVLESDGESTNNPGFDVASCISEGRSTCLRMAEQFGIDRIVVHEDWNAAYFGARSGIPVVSSSTVLAYLLNQQSGSSRPIARSRKRRVAVARSGSVSMWIRVKSLPREQDRFLSFDGFYVQLNHQNFFALFSPSRHVWSPGRVLPRSRAYYLTLTWSGGKLQLWINGVAEGRAVPFGDPPPGHVEVLPPGSAPGTKRSTSGIVRLTVPDVSCGIIPCSLRGGARVMEWGKDLVLVSLPHATPLLSSQACAAAAPAAALPPLLNGGTFVIRRGGCVRVEFLETYDKSWTLTPVSPGGRVTGHRTFNHYYNQWTVTGSPGAVYALRYSLTPSLLATSSAGALTGGAYLSSVFGVDVFLYRRRLGRHAIAQRGLAVGSRGRCHGPPRLRRLRPGRPAPGRHSRREPVRSALAHRSGPASGRVDHPQTIVWPKPNAMPESVRDRLNCRQEAAAGVEVEDARIVTAGDRPAGGLLE